MRDSVRGQFVGFTEGFEGSVPWMYLDILGLVTTAIGNLIDPIGLAMPLPWVTKAQGLPAARHEVIAEWQRVKAMQQYKLYGGGHRVFRDTAQLVLTDDGILRVVLSKLEENEKHLRKRFTEWDEWPADAQLATHSMAWACGAGFKFPLLAEALNRQEFDLAASECHINDTHNPGVRPRNAANKILYKNAARVIDNSLDPNVLYYPRTLTTEPTVVEFPHTDYVVKQDNDDDEPKGAA